MRTGNVSANSGSSPACCSVRVAVLLATYNGAKYLDEQIRSLTQNRARFTLHWIDDHSTDGSRDIVRAAARRLNVPLREWNQPTRLGVPNVFFRLMESADADIYLFCDQDDIWQTGKIDAAVANLAPDVTHPVLCFSELLLFRNNLPSKCYRFSQVFRARPEAALEESRSFMSGFVSGNTQAFTRSLRDIFISHKEIACAHALMHDLWMYLIAMAAGAVRILHGAPTTLYRIHENNASGAFTGWAGTGAGHFVVSRSQWQLVRRGLSRWAQGFILASTTLPCGPKLEQLLRLARLVSTFEQRQSVASLVRLALMGALWPDKRLAFSFAMTCLLTDAAPTARP